MAERVGFEPTCPVKGKTLSRRPRYDHFGTSPLEESQELSSIPRDHVFRARTPPFSVRTGIGFYDDNTRLDASNRAAHASETGERSHVASVAATACGPSGF